MKSIQKKKNLSGCLFANQEFKLTDAKTTGGAGATLFRL